jgi:allophanate hydrolase
VAGIGRRLGPGDTLPLGEDPGGPVDVTLDVAPRCGGGELRLVASVQTGLFAPATRVCFVVTTFRAGRGDRMGLALLCDGDGFAADGQRSLVSGVIVPGDVQMTGTGAPFVLLEECQTTGGYPRIGAVIPSDIPRTAQAAPGNPFRFRFVFVPEALAALARDRAEIAALAPRPLRRVLDTATLIAAQLVGGVVDAHADFLFADPFAKEARFRST